MNGYDGPDDEPELSSEEESFGRPFLGQQIRDERADGNAFSDSEPELVAGVSRPYLITGGRTGGGAAGIGIETILVRDRTTRVRPGEWAAETAAIITACESPVAVAEVAARIGLPVGVVQVLAGDLVAAQVLLRSASATTLALADDVSFIERLINGVAAL